MISLTCGVLTKQTSKGKKEKRGKPRTSLLTRENQPTVTRGEAGGGGGKPARGIKEGTWDGYWAMCGSAESVILYT